MINKINLAGFFAVLLMVGCSMENSVEEESATKPNVRYNEFMECKFGPDMSTEKLTAMISEWQKLITTESLIGAWGYSPASEENAWGESGFWELEWDSKEAAESAWADWEANEEAAAWNEKYLGVMQCDGPGRFKHDGIFPIPYETYGEANSSGYFYSEFHICKYNEGAGREDAVAFLPGFTQAVAQGDYEGTGYHYGNYFPYDVSETNPEGESADFIWANFTKSKAANEKATTAFESDVREKMFPIFSEFASCGDKPELFHGWALYDRDNKDFMPSFALDN